MILSDGVRPKANDKKQAIDFFCNVRFSMETQNGTLQALKERERAVDAELMEAKAKEQPLRQQAREKESQLTR